MKGHKFLMGSKYFFDCFQDFTSHDTDYIILEEDPKDYKNVKNIRGNGQDIFYWRKMKPAEFISHTIASGTPMQIGKFLIPEVARELGFTIKDLKKLEPLVRKLDDKHKYESIIFYAYLENEEFSLTGEQLDAAYREYKKYRPDSYK